MEGQPALKSAHRCLGILTFSSVPKYHMGFYMLPEETHAIIDSLRSTFFWSGKGEKPSYHMASWDSLCRPNDFVGLGFLNTRIMNIALISKWIDKLANHHDSMWSHLLRTKYLGGKKHLSVHVFRGVLGFGEV